MRLYTGATLASSEKCVCTVRGRTQPPHHQLPSSPSCLPTLDSRATLWPRSARKGGGGGTTWEPEVHTQHSEPRNMQLVPGQLPEDLKVILG